MARRVTCQGMTCVLVLAVCGWHEAFAAELSFVNAEAEDDLPDMSRVKAMAEAGRAGHAPSIVPPSLQASAGTAVGSTSSPPASTAITARLPATTLTNLPRVQRVEAPLAVEPTLQGAQPASPPSSAPR